MSGISVLFRANPIDDFGMIADHGPCIARARNFATALHFVSHCDGRIIEPE
jgi:hypothetical protein